MGSAMNISSALSLWHCARWLYSVNVYILVGFFAVITVGNSEEKLCFEFYMSAIAIRHSIRQLVSSVKQNLSMPGLEPTTQRVLNISRLIHLLTKPTLL